MDKFASYINNFLDTNSNLANPSGSGGVGLFAATAFFGLAGLAAGVGLAPEGKGAEGGALGSLATVGAAALGSKAIAKLMTSPGFVNWLAKGTNVPINKGPEYFGQLTAIAQDDPYVGEAIADFMNQITLMTDPTILGTDFQGRRIENE
jgi:hypothetical protein